MGFNQDVKSEAAAIENNSRKIIKVTIKAPRGRGGGSGDKCEFSTPGLITL